MHNCICIMCLANAYAGHAAAYGIPISEGQVSYIFEHILLNLWPLEVFARLSMATQVEMSARYERVINIVCTHMHHMFITMCLLMHVSLYPTDMRTEGLHPYPFTSSLPTWVSTLVWWKAMMWSGRGRVPTPQGSHPSPISLLGGGCQELSVTPASPARSNWL